MKILVKKTGQVIVIDYGMDEIALQQVLPTSNGMTPVYIREYPDMEGYAFSLHPITISNKVMDKLGEGEEVNGYEVE